MGIAKKITAGFVQLSAFDRALCVGEAVFDQLCVSLMASEDRAELERACVHEDDPGVAVAAGGAA